MKEKMSFEQGDIERISNPRIHLEFFRHEEKEKWTAPPQDGKVDAPARLSPEGRQRAIQSGRKEIDMSSLVVFGSSIPRAQETAVLRGVGKKLELSGDEPFEEMLGRMNEGLPHQSSKLGIDSKRLEGILDLDTPYGKQWWEQYKAGKVMKFIVERSDALAQELHDTRNLTYSKAAHNIADIISRYIRFIPRWEKKQTDSSSQDKEEMNRLFGTHETIPESFLARLIELRKGIEERDRFIEFQTSVAGGFEYGEGFSVDIFPDEEEPKVKIHFSKQKGDEMFVYDDTVPVSVIEQI